MKEYSLSSKAETDTERPTSRRPLVQSLSHVRLFATSWTAAHQAALYFTISWRLLELMSIESVMPSNHLILCQPLLLLPSGSFLISWLFASGGQTIGASASASVLPMNILISFRIELYDLEVQGTLKSLLQHHSSKASILRRSAFFIAQVAMSHNYASSYSHVPPGSLVYVISLLCMYATKTVLARDSVQ